jgi:hypothetical protein
MKIEEPLKCETKSRATSRNTTEIISTEQTAVGYLAGLYVGTSAHWSCRIFLSFGGNYCLHLRGEKNLFRWMP